MDSLGPFPWEVSPNLECWVAVGMENVQSQTKDYADYSLGLGFSHRKYMYMEISTIFWKQEIQFVTKYLKLRASAMNLTVLKFFLLVNHKN